MGSRKGRRTKGWGDVACLATVGVLVMVLYVPQAWAANLFIDDSVGGEITLTHDSAWEFPVDSNGTAFPALTGGSTTVPGENATFTGDWKANSPGVPDPGSGVIYFVGANDPTLVSDIVSASWSSVGDPRQTIAIQVQSSAPATSLGPLPPAFAGLAIAESSSAIEVHDLFRDPATGNPVSIPSNLTIQFISTVDAESPATAPALSPAGLVLAALSLLGLGIWVTRKRAAAPAV